MSLDIAALPNDVESLKALVHLMHQQHEATQRRDRQRIAYLEEQLRLMLQKRFGAASEKHAIEQLGLFNEAETPEPEEIAETPSTTEVASHQRRRGKRAPLPDFLPRIDEIHDLPDAEKICPRDGHALHRRMPDRFD